MSILPLRPARECRYDLIALGEVMLRLDPGDGRVATTRTFSVSEGGGEYNVARGLKRCFGLRAGLVSALADNPVGRLIEDLLYQGGVEQAHLDWREYDGVGRAVRNPLNFTERGFGVRGALGCSDRGHSAASQMKPGDVDWDRIFGADGVRWFHTGGVFSALSASTRDLAAEAMQAARRHGTVVSYDLNFRPSLWRHAEVPPAEVNRQLVQYADVVIGNEEDYAAALGYPLRGVGEDLLDLNIATYQQMLARVIADFPRLAIAAATLRQVRTASANDWSAVGQTRDSFHEGRWMAGLDIFDRVGGGDSFVSGLAYGLLSDLDVDTALAFGIAHGALAMTTPGDTSMATLAEVRRLAAGRSARVIR
jgi:2-dehydro-3-deoxygluconokinase